MSIEHCLLRSSRVGDQLKQLLTWREHFGVLLPAASSVSKQSTPPRLAPWRRSRCSLQWRLGPIRPSSWARKWEGARLWHSPTPRTHSEAISTASSHIPGIPPNWFFFLFPFTLFFWFPPKKKKCPEQLEVKIQETKTKTVILSSYLLSTIRYNVYTLHPPVQDNIQAFIIFWDAFLF